MKKWNVMRLALIAGAVVALAAVAPVYAQTATAPSPYKTPFMSFKNPAKPGKHHQGSVGGASCGRNPAAAQNTVNPITGQPQAQTIVSIPLNGNAGVQNATTRQQQTEACAHHH